MATQIVHPPAEFPKPVREVFQSHIIGQTVDGLGRILDNIKALEAQASELKASLRPFAGSTIVGREYEAEIVPTVTYGKVDYRARLVKVVGADKVEVMEAKARKKQSPGTPRVVVCAVSQSRQARDAVAAAKEVA